MALNFVHKLRKPPAPQVSIQAMNAVIFAVYVQMLPLVDCLHEELCMSSFVKMAVRM